MDKLVDQQSMEPDPERRKKIVREIERKLAEDPVIYRPLGGTCLQPWVKGLTISAALVLMLTGAPQLAAGITAGFDLLTLSQQLQERRPGSHHWHIIGERRG